MPYYTFICRTCGKLVTCAYRSNAQNPPIYCSVRCRCDDPNRKQGPPTKLRITVNCLNCGKEMQVLPNRIKDGRGKFCSRSCVSKYYHTGLPKPKSRENIQKAIESNIGRIPWNKKPTVSTTCEICGKVFELCPSHAKGARYCSRECAHEAKRRVAGPDHPLWRRVQMTCEICGKSVHIIPAKIDEFRFCSRQCQGTYTSMKMAERNGPTDIEKLLMDELDHRGISYRTQHLVAHWLIDITLPQYRIAIECDGNYWHDNPEQQRKDANKDRWLRAHKWEIFRFWGSKIRESPSDCIDKVLAYIDGL